MMPICGTCQLAMHETYQVACIYLDLQENPAFIRFGEEFECPKCGHKVVSGFAKYLAYSTDTMAKNGLEFKDELRKVLEFPGEVRYVYPTA